MATEFKLPDLGEGVEAGDVVGVLVAEGDAVGIDQGVVELETDKALVEVPCSVAGIVTEVHVSEGDHVPVGQVLISVEEGEKAEGDPAPKADRQPAPVAEPVRRSDAGRAAVSPSVSPAPTVAPSNGDPVPAAPITRRLARELGVDLAQVAGSGPGGRISQDDVKAAVRNRQVGGVAPVAPLPDFSKWGAIERQPLSKVRQIIAQNMSRAWREVAHVTQFDRADVTDLEAFRQRNKADAEALGAKLTPTVLALKPIIAALKTFPQFNASLDPAANELILKRYYNLGIAVDTARGLLVPVIKDVDRKDILEVALELGDISQRARNNKIGLDELHGGTFTVTNLGSLGVGEFTPIVNHPEVAILGFGRAREEAAVRNGRVVPRLIMPLALSYDHRAIDGADGARFMRKIVDALEKPELMLLGGS